MTRKLNRHTLALWAALPMARTAQVENRLQMILKPNTSRRALTRRAIVMSLVAAALGVGTLAALRPTARAQSDAATVPTAWKQTLANGATVEVLGVSDPLTGSSQWWKPDGSPLAAPLIISTTTITITAKGQRMFAVRVTPPPSGPQWVSATYEVSGTSSVGSTDTTLTPSGQHLPGLYAVLAGADALPTSSTLRCGVAAGAWQTYETKMAANVAGGSGAGTQKFIGDKDGTLLFSRLSEINGSAAITIIDTFPGVERRVVAVDTQGRIYLDSSPSSNSISKMRQSTSVFDGLPLKRVKGIQFQARPYQWAEFKNVTLKPSQH